MALEILILFFTTTLFSRFFFSPKYRCDPYANRGVLAPHTSPTGLGQAARAAAPRGAAPAYISARARARAIMVRLIQEIARNAACVMTVSWISVIIVGRVFDFHRSYVAFTEQTRSEQWLLGRCQDDHFYHNMAYHTDVCALVVSNSQISPTLFAINASMAQMKMCGLYECSTVLLMISTGGVPLVACCVLLYVMAPSFLLPLAQDMYEKRAQTLLQRRCSPLLHKVRDAVGGAQPPQYARFSDDI